MSTAYERTARVAFENRTVFLFSNKTTQADRTVEIPKEKRHC
jgi:hypothetical protein